MKKKILSLALAGSMVFCLATSAGAVSAGDFSDVKAGDWYYSAVDHATQMGYFNGVSPTLFAPDEGMTRAMAVTVLARRFAESLDGYTGVTPFTDVPAGAYYAKAVQWAVENGITDGTAPTRFSPDEILTREQLATFFYRAIDLPDLAPEMTFVKFSDKDDTSSWAVTALKWVTYLGIIRGDNGKLKPLAECTRAMVATIFMNYDEYCGISTPSPDPSPDPSPVPTPDPEPDPDPDPAPNPDPGTDDSAAQEKAMEDKINALLQEAWDNVNPSYAIEDPQLDTGYLKQAAGLIAAGEQSDVEAALTAVGFDKPFGRTDYDQYTYEEYHVNSYTESGLTADAIFYFLSQRDSLVIPGFTDYGIACHKVSDSKYTIAIVTYTNTPYSYSNIDIDQIQRDWLEEQAAIPVTLSAYEQEVLDLVNAERAKVGLNPLKASADTQAAAKIRAQELVQNCSHTRPDGQIFYSVYGEVGCSLVYTSPIDQKSNLYAHAGENIAWYYKTPAEVVNGWMDSEGHRANILNEAFTHMGIATAPARTGYYWAQVFLGVSPHD